MSLGIQAAEPLQGKASSDERGKTLNPVEVLYGTTSLSNSLKSDCPTNMLKA